MLGGARANGAGVGLGAAVRLGATEGSAEGRPDGLGSGDGAVEVEGASTQPPSASPSARSTALPARVRPHRSLALALGEAVPNRVGGCLRAALERQLGQDA